MPFLGQGSTVGRRNANLAGFPTSGLIALYRGTETSGPVYDSVGNFPMMIPETGLGMDCSAKSHYVVDSTAAHEALTTLDATLAAHVTIRTPAHGGGTTQHRIITADAAANAPFALWLIETTVGGRSVFGVNTECRVSIDGGGSTQKAVNFSGTQFSGLEPDTTYEIIVRWSHTTTNIVVELCYRRGPWDDWVYVSNVSATVNTTVTFLAGAVNPMQLLVTGTTTSRFQGRIARAFFVHNATLQEAKDLVNLASASLYNLATSKTAIVAWLSGKVARYWSFALTSGTVVEEWATAATTTITVTGAVTWSCGIGGAHQSHKLSDFNGIRLGGDAAWPGRTGVLRSLPSVKPMLSSDTGWTVLVCCRIGNQVQAGISKIFSVYSVAEDNTMPTTDKLPGVHIYVSVAQQVCAYNKRLELAVGNAGETIVVGRTTTPKEGGALGVYAISCSSSGAIQARRVDQQSAGAVIQSATGTTDADKKWTRANRVQFGDGVYGYDIKVGFGGIYNREITDAELVQYYVAAVAGLTQTSNTMYVDASSAGGNGTQMFPYTTLGAAVRTFTGNDTVNIADGSYAYPIVHNSNTIEPPIVGTVRLVGESMAGTTIVGGATGALKPIFAQEGSWYLTDLTLDANSQANNAADMREGCDVFDCERVTFKNALAADSTGSGFTSRAMTNRMRDVVSHNNGEHAGYFRLLAASRDGTYTIDVDGFTAYANTEDGIKVSNELSDNSGARDFLFWNAQIFNFSIDEAKNCLFLTGLRDSVIGNGLITGFAASGIADASSAIRIGHAGGEEVIDTVLANITVADYDPIYGEAATAPAIRVNNATGLRLVNIVTSGCNRDYDVDDNASNGGGAVTVEYCAGDSGASGYEFPTGSGNLPEATIIFTTPGSVYTLTALSDGYGDGTNLTDLADELQDDLAGTERPSTGAWNMGAY